MADTSIFRSAVTNMAGYVPGEQPPPGKYIKLNTNENPYPPPALVVEAIRAAAGGPLNRYPDPMATAFRRAGGECIGLARARVDLGRKRKRRDSHDSCPGIRWRRRAIATALSELCSVSHAGRNSGSEVGAGRISKTVGSLPAAFGQPAEGLKLVLLPNPNSPSGTMVSPRRGRRSFAQTLNCPLVVDEAYADFAEQNCLKLVQQNPRILVTRTLSKSYGLAGIRFGFLVANPDVIRELAKIKDSYNCDGLSIAAATAAMGCRDWLAETCGKIIATRAANDQEADEIGFSGHSVSGQLRVVPAS